METDTSITTGDCAALAAKVAGHLKQAGFADDQLTPFSVPDHPKEGGLVAVLPGADKTLKPMLLLGHIDVVTARRADWTRDPYKMVEESGYFWGRGTADMKAMDAIWIDSLIRMKEAGGGGRTDGHGKLLIANLHVGEKLAVNYRIEATNPGGHSSAPVKDNAIYELADALAKLRDFDFPAQLSDTTRAYFAKAGAARGDDLGKAMMAFAKNPGDKQAEVVLDADKSYHSMLRTTCVATLLDGGHAENALPQRAGANVNCRIFPGTSPQQVRDTLEKVIADPRMTVKLTDDRGGVVAKPPPLDPKIIDPAETLLAKYYPGVPLVPFMSTGATDGVFLEQIGIPVYGPPGLYGDPDGNGTHGLNEHEAVEAVYTGRDYLFDLIKAYAG